VILAGQALELLTETQRIISYWEANYDQDMHEGTDFQVILGDGAERPLQIKSSWSGFKKARENYPEVPCVVIEPGDPIVTIMANILHVLERK